MAKPSSDYDKFRWFNEARYGMFLHWGLYSQIERGELIMHTEQIPVAEYEKLADTWTVRGNPARAWARLAKRAGMKYMVLTAKHCDGFCLWDTKMTPYNAVQRGPRRDLLAQYVAAARAEGMRVGFYYSFVDWHNPDCQAFNDSPAARRRFVEFTRGLIGELLSNYGPIDMLWYDAIWPFNARTLQSRRLDQLVRRLQPRILTNDRSWIPGDFTTTEGRIVPSDPGRNWEACMMTNDSWGYAARPSCDWICPRDILRMIRSVTGAGGNLLLNVGPKADGSLPAQAEPLLTAAGNWLAQNGEAVYGKMDRRREPLNDCWTHRGNTGYYWCTVCYPRGRFAIGAVERRVQSVTLLPGGKSLKFKQEGTRLIIENLPARNPDPIAQMPVLKIIFG
ncbi:MAG: alpha-L-fucosidase [Planctomycetaceae bacterium]|nr:alpha-L-fucosidase [Planctomycetaceae bacterium]